MVKAEELIEKTRAISEKLSELTNICLINLGPCAVKLNIKLLNGETITIEDNGSYYMEDIIIQ